MSAASAAFYSTAAQVLPVLFLAIAFEQGFWRSSEATRVFGLQTGRLPTAAFARAAAALMLLFPIVLFVGEWLALMAVNGNEVEVARYFVTGALVLAGIVVALPPLWIGLPAWLPRRETPDRLDFPLARAVIVALSIACALFVALGIVLAIV